MANILQKFLSQMRGTPTTRSSSSKKAAPLVVDRSTWDSGSMPRPGASSSPYSSRLQTPSAKPVESSFSRAKAVMQQPLKTEEPQKDKQEEERRLQKKAQTKQDEAANWNKNKGSYAPHQGSSSHIPYQAFAGSIATSASVNPWNTHQSKKKKDAEGADIKKRAEAAAPDRSWLGVHEYSASPIYDELTTEQYNQLDARQKAAVDFNTSLQGALEADKAGGKLSKQILDAASNGNWSGVVAPKTQALMEEFNLKDSGFELKDVLSGRASIGSESMDILRTQPHRGDSQKVIESETASWADKMKASLDVVKDGAPSKDPAENRKSRDAELAENIQTRMAEIFKENRLPGEAASEAAEEPKEFSDLYSIISGYGATTDREGVPGLQSFSGEDIRDTLEASGLSGKEKEFARYVQVRLSEELNADDSDDIRRAFLNTNGPEIVRLAQGG